MYCLIFWTESQESSIMKLQEIQPPAAEGDMRKVKYDGLSYDVKILKINSKLHNLFNSC